MSCGIVHGTCNLVIVRTFDFEATGEPQTKLVERLLDSKWALYRSLSAIADLVRSGGGIKSQAEKFAIESNNFAYIVPISPIEINFC